MSDSIIENLEINGIKLSFSISKIQENKPIILYLHGGPGDACIPLTKKFNSELEESFIFVNFDQRGAGLSYYPFSKDKKITIDDILDDIYQFVIYLLGRFNQEKLILMGHSWGGALGLLFIQKYPELIYQYIGIGQVVNMKKNIELQKRFLENKLGNTNTFDKLDFDNELISSSLKLNKKVLSNGGSIYGEKNMLKLITPLFISKYYSMKQFIRHFKGSYQSVNSLWSYLLELNFENVTNFDVPIIFCEGRYDNHVSSLLVSEYACKITSPVEILWFEKSGHFPHWEEADKFNEIIKDSFK